MRAELSSFGTNGALYGSMMNGLFYTAFLILTQFSWAQNCPHSATFTAPENVVLRENSLVLVTHAAAIWDTQKNAKKGVDKTIAFGKKNGIPIVYLQQSNNSSNTDLYYAEDCNPNYSVESINGEVSFDIQNVNHVYSVGGHWDACEWMSVDDIIKQWSIKAKFNYYTITYIIDGLYLWGKIYDSDYPQFNIKKDIYSEKWNRVRSKMNTKNDTSGIVKMNLEQTLEVIDTFEKHKEVKLKKEFLKRVLPMNLQLVPEQYRIELWYNGENVETIRESTSGVEGDSPVLKLDYRTSNTLDE